MTLPIDYGDADWQFESLSKFHRQHQRAEREYLEIRTLLRDAEAALRTKPEDGELELRVYYLRKRLGDLEAKYPWLLSGKPPEIAFWVPPCG